MGATRCPRCGVRRTRPPDTDNPIGGFPVLVDKKTAEQDVARFGSVTAPLGVVVPRRSVTRWILIMITTALLLIFLILTLMKDPLNIFREDPPGLGRGSAARSVSTEVGQLGSGDGDIPSLGPGAVRLPPDELQVYIGHSDSKPAPPVDVEGLADGDPPTCWVPQEDGERLIVDAGARRLWSHLLLYRCSLPNAGAEEAPELTVELSTAAGHRLRLLRLRKEDAPTRVDIGGIETDQLVLTLRPTHASSGLSGVVGFHFEEATQ